MSNEEFWGNVEFSVSAGLVPWGGPDQYVHAVTGRALDVNEDEAGTITLKLVSSTEAENQGEPLFEICDADSAILEAIHASLFDTTGETKDELDIEPGWNNLLFIEAVETKPAFQESSLRVQLIETSIALFCSSGLIVAEEEALDLSVHDWRQLGFKRIAESPFVFRDQLRLNPYDRSTTEIDGEGSYTCDACGEEIVIPVDLSLGSNQEYVEDCPVCCRANVIHVEIDDVGNVTVWAVPEQDLD